MTTTTSSASRAIMKSPMRSWPNSPADGSARRVVRILGIDPGLRHTGWGVIDAVDNRLQFVADGVVEPDPSASLAERLRMLFAAVQALVVTYGPHECAIEDTFVNQN